MAQLLKGAPVAESLNRRTAERAARLAERGVTPTLAIVRLGERPDDMAYERGAVKRCGKLGVAVRTAALPASATQDTLVAELNRLNADAAVHGILLLRPLPKTMDECAVRNTLAPEKDVDGITDASLAGVFTQSGHGYPPCTARACMEILDYYGIDPAGKNAVVLGRSLVVGKPVAMLLLAKNATVTLCHTRTKNLPAVCRQAGLLVVSAGRAGIVDGACLAPGQVVVDVGINADAAGNLCGDVDFTAAEPLVAALTPVPGGVGAVTTSLLALHVTDAAERAARP